MPDSVFIEQDHLFLPTELARGPWNPQAQHGGAPAALLARALERFDGGGAMLVTRLTIELLRPVPIAPLRLETALLRPGKKVQLVRASLFAEETEVARCTGLRLRRAPIALPADLPVTPLPPPPASGRDSAPLGSSSIGYAGFHNRAVEHRFVAGGFEQAGPATDWIRLRVPLIAGEETSPLCSVAAACDFGNGVSRVLNPLDGYQFINPDLTIYLYRKPHGEWVCLDAVTHVAPEGVGMAESRVFDEAGLLGRAVQSLLLEKM
jgi:hypothetical protein